MSKIKDDYIKSYLKKLGTLSLIPVNKSNFNNIGTINLEMYIDSNNEYSGYYIYTLKYSNDRLERGVIEECLKYKKKCNSKIEKEIFKIQNNTISEIGYKIAYKANLLNDLTGKV